MDFATVFRRRNSSLQTLSRGGFTGVLQIAGRFVYLAALLSPALLLLPFCYYSRSATFLHWYMKYLVKAIQYSGPTFTKLGQWAGSRTDLFSLDVCRHLSQLQSQARAHSYQWTESSILHALGKPITEIFSHFEREPVGVGAVAQVHYARLPRVELEKNDEPEDPFFGTFFFDDSQMLIQKKAINACEQDVAVKVLHPDVVSNVYTDLKIMHSFAYAIESLVPEAHWLSLPEEVSIFGEMMVAQLDLRIEHSNLELFYLNFAGWPNVAFPLPVSSLPATYDVLVESFVDGTHMVDFLDTTTPFDKELASIGVTTFLKMLLLDNHVHADMHPGNIIIQFTKGSTVYPSTMLQQARKISLATWQDSLVRLRDDGYKPLVYFIDAGLSTSLTDASMSNFVALFKAVTHFDGNLISQLMIERSNCPDSVINRHDFQDQMTQFIANIKHKTLQLRSFSVNTILSFVLTKVREHHIKIDPQFINIAVGLMLVEGIGQRLDPDMDLLTASLPFLNLAIQRQLSLAQHHTGIKSAGSLFGKLGRTF